MDDRVALKNLRGSMDMFYSMPEDELRSICRINIEAFEKWARTVIHYELTNNLGENYFDMELTPGVPVVKKSIREKSSNMMQHHPKRFSRKIDTLFLEEIIYLLCKDDLYKRFFKNFLDLIYPDGNAEARTFLNRLIPIRNCLSHSNPISIRDAERCICYTNDFIAGVKQYFYEKGKGRVFNTPNAIKLNDSLGNEFQLNKDTSFESIYINKVGTNQLYQFYIGEKYSVWLTLDPSFEPEQYTFDWHIECGRHLGSSSRLDIEIAEDMIRERCPIYCTIKSAKSWHRYRGYDQQFAIVFQVLPPEE